MSTPEESKVPDISTVKPVVQLEKKKDEGWAFLLNSRKWHYFRGGRSLCGKWMCFSYEIDEKEMINSPDNCTECKRRRLKELEKLKQP